ncbi:MAG: hypothetical protein J6J71_03520 [Prevotella sp.]|nr:hypothetical protein [Prevotella sp.]
MSSERQTKYGRSSYRLVREQRMMAKSKEAREENARRMATILKSSGTRALGGQKNKSSDNSLLFLPK